MTHEIDQKYNLNKTRKLFIKGFVIGLANAIPGVSGGTIAFMFGIYNDLILSIKSVNLRLLKTLLQFKFKEASDLIPWRFLATVFLGAGCAIITLSKVLAFLFIHNPVLILSFFFGLILATIPIMTSVIKKWTITKYIIMFLSTIATYHLVGMVPLQTPNALWFIFLCGVFAMATMILPGISGSFVLLLLGKYLFILQAVNERNLIIICVFGLGAMIGVVSIAQLLSRLLKNHHDRTMIILTAFVVGSLRKIWPWKETLSSITNMKGEVIPTHQVNTLPQAFTPELIWAIVLMVIGFLFALLINSTTKDV
ncbi:MAG: DUF368 domain-containing protein [Candidatus Omnitrophica bacterium]|nr:DUF368 domain-containing protein [Candidatus Omnitrophota bacterium]